MKNKEDIISVLKSGNTGNDCAYCMKPIRRGYYAEDGIGRKLRFPQFLVNQFVDNDPELMIHYGCVEHLLFDMIREGDKSFDGTRENTKILIRY